MKKLQLAIITSMMAFNMSAQQLAFPGAEGYDAYATALPQASIWNKPPYPMVTPM